MAGETIITIIGNLTGDPELRFTPSGDAVANFTIASTPRQFDKQAGEWKDGETLFMRCSVWREQAENVAETLRKGMRVIAQGALKARSFDTKEGERRTVNELDVEEVGPSMRFATATVNRQQGGNGGGRQSNQQGGNGGGFGGQQSNQQGGFGGGQQGGGQQGGGQQGGGQQGGNDWGGSFGGGQQNDPWGQAAPANGQGGFGSDPGATWN